MAIYSILYVYHHENNHRYQFPGIYGSSSRTKANEASRSKGKCSCVEKRFDFSLSDDKKHEAATTTMMEQELSVSKLLY